MALPTGTISMSQVNTELGNPTTSTISLNDTDVRALAEVPSGTISMSDLQGKSAAILTGGVTAEYNEPISQYETAPFTYHYYTSSEPITVGEPYTFSVFIVGGGGKGGFGGGGAGGFRKITNIPQASGSYTLTIGGASSPSSVFGYESTRGGPGGSPSASASPGGCGGGSHNPSPGGSGNSPPVSPPQGDPGGNVKDNAPNTGGGGGGATRSGFQGQFGPPAGPQGGSGGDGGTFGNLPPAYGASDSPPTATNGFFAGGGGGCGHEYGRASEGGGRGQGRADSSPSLPILPALPGETNTGGGGGGSNPAPGGANGGSGFIAIKYQTPPE